MSFLRPLVTDAQEVTRNLAAWERHIDGAANAQERLFGVIEKASLATAPPGPAPWWQGGGTGAAPSLVNQHGQPIGTGAGGSSGGGSGGPGRQRAPQMQTIYTPGFGLSWRSAEDPGFDVYEYGPPGSHPGWMWDWLAARWVHAARRVSGRSAGGGGGTGAAAPGRPQRHVAPSISEGDPWSSGGGSGPGFGTPTDALEQGKSANQVTRGEAAIAQEVRNLRQDIRNLGRGDGGAQLRRDQLV